MVDLRAAAPRLALALGVAGLRVTELAAGWVSVVVVDDVVVAARVPDDAPATRPGLRAA